MEAKPCPFCGSLDVGLALNGKCQIFCLLCGALGPEPKDHNNQGNAYSTAVDAWNERIEP